MNGSLADLVKAAFRLAGLKIQRVSDSTSQAEPPPIFDDPLEALFYQQGGKRAAFRCPLSRTRSRLGFCYGPNGWHPYVETLKEYASGRCTSYDHSILRDYYRSHQPETAADALVGFDQTPAVFEELPGHLCYLSPWKSQTVTEVDQNVRGWIRDRNVQQSRSGWDLDSDGYLLHGPVSLRKGRAAYNQLTHLYDTIAKEGYHRTHGDIQFLIARHGNDFQYLQWGDGSHRAAVLAALGHETVPGIFRQPRRIIDVEMADYWPQVRHGVWDRSEAEAFVRHLFAFDSRRWARSQGLTLGETAAKSKQPSCSPVQ